MGEITKEKLNGIDTEALKQVMGQVSKDPSLGKVKFQVTTTWKGTTKSETVVQGYEIGGDNQVGNGGSRLRNWWSEGETRTFLCH